MPQAFWWGALNLGDTTMIVEWAVDWAKNASCRGSNPDELFVQGAAQNRAKAVCMGCPVRTECLADALDNRVEFGVWGGMTGSGARCSSAGRMSGRGRPCWTRRGGNT